MSDWSSDVCSSDLLAEACGVDPVELRIRNDVQYDPEAGPQRPFSSRKLVECLREGAARFGWNRRNPKPGQVRDGRWLVGMRSAEHTSELQSLMRISYAVFCLKKKKYYQE